MFADVYTYTNDRCVFAKSVTAREHAVGMAAIANRSEKRKGEWQTDEPKRVEGGWLARIRFWQPVTQSRAFDTDPLLLAGRILATFALDCETGIILIDRGMGHADQYVVAHYRSGASEWQFGHYFAELDSAVRHFADVTAESYHRDYC